MRRETPGPGQESVWDYPRPPTVEPVAARLRVVVDGRVVADSTRGARVLETSHPPVYYIPPEDVDGEVLLPSRRRSFCEWKGRAAYWHVRVDRLVEDAAWSYPRPTERFATIRDFLAFYPSKADACFVGDEVARAQPGDFYGGWITKAIVGPFKGERGTELW